MSKGEMSELKPGRELDCEVAQKVMGFIVKLDNNKYFDGSAMAREEKDFDAYDEVNTISGPTTLPRFRPLPHYSQDISAAWEVVEKFKGCEPELSWSDEVGSWYFGFNKGPWTQSEWADTAPHAICLAALKAVRAK